MRRRGLTLIEVSVALAVFFVTSVFLMSAFVYGASWPQRTQQRELLSRLSQRKMDELLAQPIAGSLAPATGDFSPDFPRYLYDVEVAPAALVDPALFDEVRVTVRFEDQEAALTALRARQAPAPPPAPDPPPPPPGAPPGPPPVDLAAQGCTSCHNAGGTGPSLDPVSLRDSASAAGYGGNVAGYVRDSLNAPSAYVRPGYQPLMQNITTGLQPSTVNALAGYLSDISQNPYTPP